MRPLNQWKFAMIRPDRARRYADLAGADRGTGVFKPMEIQALKEVLDDYHAQNHGSATVR